MAKQAIYEYEGKAINYANGGDSEVEVGSVVPFGSRVGVALETIGPGKTGGVSLTGVWRMPAVNTASFDVGDQLYWDATANKLTKVDTDTIPAGMCVAAKAESGTEASVRIG